MAGKYRVLKGDIFQMTKDEKNIIIPHVVNCKGAWGSGFVIPLGKIFPKAEQTYLDWSGQKGECESWPYFELGETLLLPVEETRNVHVAHMCAQTLGTRRPLFYNKLARCMDYVADFVQLHLEQNELYKIAAPKFASQRARGDWEFVRELIEDCWIKEGIDVTIYEL